jgi:hypothetical protein
MYDPADQFVELYPSLDEAMLVAHGEALYADPAFHTEARDVRDAVVAGTYRIDLLHDAGTLEGQRERLVAMRGIDTAFASINPMLRGAVTPAPLRAHLARFELEGRLNSDPEVGLLLPKLAWPAQREKEPLQLAHVFKALTLVPPDAMPRIELLQAPLRSRMSRDDRLADVTIACAPVAEAEPQIEFDVADRGGERYYAGELHDDDDMRDRCHTLLAELDRVGVHGAVLPELCCSATMVTHWQDLLRSSSRPRPRSLRWLFAGTGNLDRCTPRAENAGALLDADTGEVIVHQRKQFPFDIEPAQHDDYPLSFVDGKSMLREDIVPGYGSRLVELGAARVVVLICEDLARMDPLIPSLVAAGVSHIIAPVFSKPTMPFHWEQQQGGNWAKASGATAIVANSLVIGRLIETSVTRRAPRAELHTALVTSPKAMRRSAAPTRTASSASCSATSSGPRAWTTLTATLPCRLSRRAAHGLPWVRKWPSVIACRPRRPAARSSERKVEVELVARDLGPQLTAQ